MKIKNILIILLISISMTSYAQKEISGSLSGILGPGKYIVTGTIKVETGKSLTIVPGTTFIHEQGNYSWEIKGLFKAIGTQKDSIYFLSKKGIEQNQRWGGLHFLEGSLAAILDYCVVANTFIVEFTTSTSECFAAVNVCNGNGITIKHSRISNNYGQDSGCGIYVKESIALIDHCRIVHNCQNGSIKGIGIFLEDSNNSKIMNSVIAYNKNGLGSC
jgi:hypothetical protein